MRASGRFARIAIAAKRSGGRVAVWIAWDSAAFRGEEGVAKGWLQRARRLLDGQPESPEHAFLAARADGVRAARRWRSGSGRGAGAGGDPRRVRRSARSTTRWSDGRCMALRSSRPGRVPEGLRDSTRSAPPSRRRADRPAADRTSRLLPDWACDRARDHAPRRAVVRPHQGTQPQVGAEAAVRRLPHAVRVGVHVARRLGRSRTRADERLRRARDLPPA